MSLNGLSCSDRSEVNFGYSREHFVVAGVFFARSPGEKLACVPRQRQIVSVLIVHVVKLLFLQSSSAYFAWIFRPRRGRRRDSPHSRKIKKSHSEI